jgi:hypothetical protein
MTQTEMFAIPCQRCGKLCRPGGEGNPDAMPLRKANRGYCADCAMTRFIKAVPTFMLGIERHGVEILRWPTAREGFARLMEVGQSDVRASEIDWDRVIANWRLP